MTSERTRFYRDKQNSKLMGVCAGIGDYTGVDPLLVRVGFLGLTFMSGGLTIPFYFLVGLLANKKPQHLYIADKQEQKFWQGVRQSPARTARDVKSQLREIDRRLADVELFYTSSNARLSDEIERLR